MEAHHASTTAQNSEMTVTVSWFKMDTIRAALPEGDTRNELAQLMNECVNEGECTVSWWDIDAWSQEVDTDNQNAVSALQELSAEAQA